MRLHFKAPPPAGWVPGWRPVAPSRRCGCGARIVSRCSRFTSCERGCVHLEPEPPPPVRAPPRPPAKERATFKKLIVHLRMAERDYVALQRMGRPVPAKDLEGSFRAMELLWELCPGHGAEIVAALPWLTRQAARRPAA